ncbi:MAG: sn-glycerol-3-phosphate ABC transporter ATP-binding protein UgpC [Armatimonadetes bacterium]|nr:sn-glycerol-3-phosphate ABC transporter ATP-binding protein UgpC [Armatimonadota bacterium]
MAQVVLHNVNKIFEGSIPEAKSWYEFWKPGSKKKDVHVVRDVSLEIKDGEFLVLVGPSGCGKSTTLRMVAGLEEISSGEISIDGRTVAKRAGGERGLELSPKDRDIAMVFQNYALYPHMNVFENMAFGLRLRKMPDSEINERVNKAAALLKIEPFLHRKPKELSGGQRQRVAMGRAIVRRPKVFLMDEPLSNLDAKLRVQMRAELQKLHRTLGVTTIYVTHDQTEAMTLGDRIVLMRDGIIQQMDSPLNIYEKPANQYVAGFIGSPPMNFVNVTVEVDNGQVWLKSGGFRIEVPAASREPLLGANGKAAVLGIRPEDLYDQAQARDAQPGNTFEATVDVFEPMGAEVYLYLTAGEDALVARVDPHTAVRVGDRMRVVIDMGKMHVFDRETEAAIVHGERAVGDAAGDSSDASRG